MNWKEGYKKIKILSIDPRASFRGVDSPGTFDRMMRRCVHDFINAESKQVFMNQKQDQPGSEIEPITFNDEDLKNIFSEIEEFLFNPSNIYEIKYENKNNTKLNYTKNNQDFINAIKGKKSAVYCIWLKQEGVAKFDPVYVGRAVGHDKASPSDRMRAHLSSKGGTTKSCLEKVQKEVEHGGTIGVTFVKIEPSYMRAAVEGYLICTSVSRNEKSLPWNDHDRN